MDDTAEPIRIEPLVPPRRWPEAQSPQPGAIEMPRPIRLETQVSALVRPETVALAALLAGTAALYVWNLAASGWANAYYSAASLAGSQDWTAWFFGSFDAGNAITVDKTPAALWVTGLSVRLFGLSSWSVLVPQALMGVAAVALTLLGGTTWMRNGFWAPDGDYSRFVSPIIGLVWVVIVSRVLLTRSPATRLGW